jgi:Xaa-Pro aminopeptidase
MSDLYPPDRLARAHKATAEAGLDALLLTPGADLRYLTGYDAHPLERLTCLVLTASGSTTLVVPELERAAALASPASSLDLAITAWPEGGDAYALVRGLLYGACDGPPARVGVANRMWAEQALAFRAALPGTEQALAGPVLRELRMRKSGAEIEALRQAAHAIDAVHARMGGPGARRPRWAGTFPRRSPSRGTPR